MEAKRTRYSDVSLYRRLLRLAQPYWPHIGGIFLLDLLRSGLALLNPVPLKIAVDSVIGARPLPGILDPLTPELAKSSDTGKLLIAAGLLLVISMTGKIQGLASSLLSTYTGEKDRKSTRLNS